MRQLLATALMLLAAPAVAQSVEFAGGDWGNMPALTRQGDTSVDSDVVAAIGQMVDRGECTIPGQSRGALDMNVAFLVQYRADGGIGRLVLHPSGCARADALLGGAVMRLVEQGAFAPEGGRRQGWFRGEVAVHSSD